MPESNWQETIQAYLPNSITFLSLASGLTSIVLSSQELILPAICCILFSIFLDTLDGYLARKLNRTSIFGKQLDSLADIVNFGVAPILVVWQHLDIGTGISYWILPVFIAQLLAGAFRLARFNLQAPKKSSQQETLGLTITQSGLMLMLAVLSDLTLASYDIPVWIYLLISLFVSTLMVSKFIIPTLSYYAPSRKSLIIYLVLGVILSYFSSVFTVLLVFYLAGLTISVSRQVLI